MRYDPQPKMEKVFKMSMKSPKEGSLRYWQEKYGVHERVIRRITKCHLLSMTEDARQILINESKRLSIKQSHAVLASIPKEYGP